MSDLFTFLAQRAVQAATALRPRSPSVFESNASSEVDLDSPDPVEPAGMTDDTLSTAPDDHDLRGRGVPAPGAYAGERGETVLHELSDLVSPRHPAPESPSLDPEEGNSARAPVEGRSGARDEGQQDVGLRSTRGESSATPLPLPRLQRDAQSVPLARAESVSRAGSETAPEVRESPPVPELRPVDPRRTAFPPEERTFPDPLNQGVRSEADRGLELRELEERGPFPAEDKASLHPTATEQPAVDVRLERIELSPLHGAALASASEPTVAQAMRNDLQATVAPPNSQQFEAPVPVTITIGKIIVATTQNAPRQNSPVRRPRPLMGLDRYLRGRTDS